MPWLSRRVVASRSVGDPRRQPSPSGLSFSTTEYVAGKSFTPKECRMLRHHKVLEQLSEEAPRVVQATDGRSLKELRAAGFTCTELLASGAFSIRELRSGGVKASELRGAGCPIYDMRPFSISELRMGGYPADELRATSQYTTGELRSGGYSAAEMRDAGFSAMDLKKVG